MKIMKIKKLRCFAAFFIDVDLYLGNWVSDPVKEGLTKVKTRRFVTIKETSGPTEFSEGSLFNTYKSDGDWVTEADDLLIRAEYQTQQLTPDFILSGIHFQPLNLAVKENEDQSGTGNRAESYWVSEFLEAEFSEVDYDSTEDDLVKEIYKFLGNVDVNI